MVRRFMRWVRRVARMSFRIIIILTPIVNKRLYNVNVRSYLGHVQRVTLSVPYFTYSITYVYKSE